MTLADDGRLRWDDGQGHEFNADPETDWLDRAIVEVESWLRIEWLL